MICTVREPSDIAAFLIKTRLSSDAKIFPDIKTFLKTSDVALKLKSSYVLFEEFYKKNKESFKFNSMTYL